MRKIYAFCFVLLATVVFISCQKEITNIIQEQSHCRIVTGYYYGGSGGLNDSVVFTYTADKVTRAENRDYYVLYFYTGNNITVRKTYEIPGNTLVFLD